MVISAASIPLENQMFAKSVSLLESCVSFHTPTYLMFDSDLLPLKPLQVNMTALPFAF